MECSYQKRYLNDLIFNAPNRQRPRLHFSGNPRVCREAIFDHNGQNAGNDMSERAAASSGQYAAAIGVAESTRVSAQQSSPAYPNNDENAVVRPATVPTSRPAHARFNNGGAYDTNSYILPFPEMAAAYGI